MRLQRKPARSSEEIRRHRYFALLVAAVCSVECSPTAGASDIRSDELVIFFPTSAHLDEAGEEWVIPIHGWIFEPESNSLRRRAALAVLRRRLGLDEESEASRILEERLGAFIADNEGGKSVVVTIGDERFELPESDDNGHIRDTLRMPQSMADRLAVEGWLTFRAETASGDDREFRARAQLISPRGLSVISDVDDTLKVSDVIERRELIRRTFFLEFEAVGGMAAFCETCREREAAFHYVSSSPWQLYPALSAFFDEAGYPEASWHLKDVGVDDLTILNLFADPFEDKLEKIEGIFSRYPRREFVLVGDSGEQDPEVYGELARRHPSQVSRILIRLAGAEQDDDDRFEQAFREVPGERWTVFEEPEGVQLD